MKILFAAPYLPVPPNFGGARRIYELILRSRRARATRTIALVGPTEDIGLAESEIGPIDAVRVPFTPRTVGVTSRRLVQIRSLASLQSSQYRLYHHDPFQHALDRAIGSGQIDLVQIEFSQMGCYHVDGRVPTVLDVHNVEHDLLRQMAAHGSPARRLFNLLEYRKFRCEEIATWQRATRCIATSADDALVIAGYVDADVPVIPNGVDLDYFQRAPESASERDLIVFTGAMRYRPNADAAGQFATEILPLIRRRIPDARFAVVGADPLPSVLALGDVPGVTVTGTVPDVRPWLTRASVVVVPLRSGGGTRLKILEAFAVGRPVVATTIGAAGIDVTDRTHLLLADDPAEYAARVVELMENDGLRRGLVDQARRLVEERYQWSAITSTLNALLDDVVALTARRLASGPS